MSVSVRTVAGRASWRAGALGVMVVVMVLCGVACQSQPHRASGEDYASAQQALREAVSELEAKDRVLDAWIARDWRHHGSWRGRTFLMGDGPGAPREVDFADAQSVRVVKRHEDWFYRVVVSFTPGGSVWLRAADEPQARRVVAALGRMGAPVSAGD